MGDVTYMPTAKKECESRPKSVVTVMEMTNEDLVVTASDGMSKKDIIASLALAAISMAGR